MVDVQAGITAPSGASALFISVWLKPGMPDAVFAELAAALSQVEELRATYPDSRLHAVLAFGGAALVQLPLAVPASMKPFAPLASGDLTAPATGGDIFLHLHGERHDLNFVAARQLLAVLRPYIDRVDEVTGFRYLDERDLTDFIDGTENPQGDERGDVAGIASPDACAGGSFVIAQRYVHKLDAWRELSDTAQEGVIGRSKAESIELEDDVRPATAHISRVVIEDDGEELEIVRHSLPFGDASGEQGLQFLAYSADISIFDRMLANMYGTVGDGLHDHLMDFTRAVSGAYFYAPSNAQLLALARGR